MLGLVSMSGWLIYWPISQGVENYTFQELHTDWTIDMVPTQGRIYQFDPIVAIVAGYLIFVFFGFGRDARDMYATWLQRVGINTQLGSPSGSRGSGVLSSLTSKATFFRSSFSRKRSTIR
jgi:pheromone a factor receptor